MVSFVTKIHFTNKLNHYISVIDTELPNFAINLPSVASERMVCTSSLL